jgi:hypothetical protein
VQISQTDWNSKGEVFGSIFNHVTPGRFADGEGLGSACYSAGMHFVQQDLPWLITQ